MRTSKATTLDPRSGQSKGREVWHAEHEGWSIDRIETRGTPWALTHLASGIDVGTFGSRQAARRAIDDGNADVLLCRRLVHLLMMWMAMRATLTALPHRPNPGDPVLRLPRLADEVSDVEYVAQSVAMR